MSNQDINYFCLIESGKLHKSNDFIIEDGIPKPKYSKILTNRVNRRINFALEQCKMKYYQEVWLFGTGRICLVITSKKVTEKFAENLFNSKWVDTLTKKPVYVLPKNWKEKKIDTKKIVEEMEKIH